MARYDCISIMEIITTTKCLIDSVINRFDVKKIVCIVHKIAIDDIRPILAILF